MKYQQVLTMLGSIPYLSVGLDVGADFTWMSIMLPNRTLVGKPFKIVHSDPRSRELAIPKIKEAQGKLHNDKFDSKKSCKSWS